MALNEICAKCNRLASALDSKHTRTRIGFFGGDFLDSPGDFNPVKSDSLSPDKKDWCAWLETSSMADPEANFWGTTPETAALLLLENLEYKARTIIDALTNALNEKP